jgi:hypothetical protein
MKPFILLFQVSAIYFNQAPPGGESKVFAPGIVSIDSIAEFGSTYSKDGSEFFFAIERKTGRAETHYRKFHNNSWSDPIPLLVHKEYSYNDPMLSPDEKRLYFISDMPITATGAKKDFDIWYIERVKDGWSKPMNAGREINSNKNEYYVSFTSSGTMYFSSGRNANEQHPKDYDVYFAKPGENAEKASPAINTENYEGDVFIAPDESYIIVASDRPDTFGSGDLFISFKDEKGKWTPLKNMGENINGPRFDYCPFVTHDGKYLLYTRAEDVRWIDAEVIKKLK